MEALSANDVLVAWEMGLHAGPVQRGLQLLCLRFPERSAGQLAQLPIGQRDAELINLRLALFGTQMQGKLGCPNCGELLELNLDGSELRRLGPANNDIVFEAAGHSVRLRLPNSIDVAEAALQPDLEAGRRKLLERCTVSVSQGGDAVSELPPELAEAAVMRLAEADPQADLKVRVSCAVCGHGWEAVFDIVSFLWNEIEAWAVRLLREVHTLASAYGWPERDILAMSAARRQMYLEMVRG